MVNHVGFGLNSIGAKLQALYVTLISFVYFEKRCFGVNRGIETFFFDLSEKVSFIVFGFSLGGKSALDFSRRFFSDGVYVVDAGIPHDPFRGLILVCRHVCIPFLK